MANRIFHQHNAHRPANATRSQSILNGPLAGPTMFFICLYHLSLIILHSSVVPLFSGRPLNRAMPQDALQKCAQTIILVSSEADLTRMGPIVGYSAFVAGSILTVCERSFRRGNSSGPQMNVPNIESEEMASMRTVLRVLRLYWKPVERLVSSYAAREHF